MFALPSGERRRSVVRNHVSKVDGVVFFCIFWRHSCHGELVEMARDRSFINMLSTFLWLCKVVVQGTGQNRKKFETNLEGAILILLFISVLCIISYQWSFRDKQLFNYLSTGFPRIVNIELSTCWPDFFCFNNIISNG
jgi:1-acyl-sn-glycerol-3-phosphate acyltransferase